MIKEVALKDLGKVVAKNEKYRLVKEDSFYRLYRLSRQMIWGENGEVTFTNKKVAIPVGYVSNPDNFEIAIYEAEEEMRYLMAQGI